MKIGTFEAPQHRPFRRKPRQDASQESGRHRPILVLRPGAAQLVKRA